MRSILAGMMLALAFAVPAQAQQFNNWFNESKYEKRDDTCTTGINGLRAKGTYGYIKSISCVPNNDAGIVVGPGQSYGTLISENRANKETHCPAGEVAVGMQCSGEYCDDVALKCARVEPAAMEITSQCAWSPKISDSDTTQYTVPAGNYVTGIKCSGPWCYQNTLKYCAGRKIQPGEPVTNAKGGWAPACSGGNCTVELEKSFTTTNASENAITTDIRSHLTSSVQTGFSVFGTEIGVSVEAGVAGGQSETKAVLNELTAGQKRKCTVTFDTQNNAIHGIWQWTFSANLLGHTYTARTCEFACTSNSNPPRFFPGSKAHIESCKIGVAAGNVTGDDILGTYVRYPRENGYHEGTVTRDGTGYRWTNAAGVTWTATLDIQNSRLLTGPNNPYASQDDPHMHLVISNGTLTGIKFLKENYARQ